MSTSPPEFKTSFQFATRSDVGMRRANNQDSLNAVLAEDASIWQQCGHLFMVADGMGAHAAGELASKLAVDNVPHVYHHFRDLGAPQALERAITEANSEIHRRGLVNPEFRGMGTTASVLVLLPEGALVGHVGDSRVYRLRDFCLEQLTFDHSLLWELQRSGRLAENSDFARSIPKNVITRSLGPNPEVAVDLEGPYALQVGDTFLLCSDGLTGQVSDEELAELLAYLGPEDAARVLVDLANLRGGPDNITLVVVKVVDDAAFADTADPKPQRRSRARGPAAGGLVFLPLAAVALFVAVLLGTAELFAPAAVFGLASLAALIAGGLSWYRGRSDTGQARAERGKLGAGPYRQQVCEKGDVLVTTLAGTLDHLREAALESGWSIRWQDVERFRRKAESAATARDFPEAVRQSAAAISFMMDELRRQQRKKSSDSSIEY